MYGWAHNCFKDMIIDAYGIEMWHKVERRIEVNKWRDDEFYPDENFMDIVNVALEQLSEYDSAEVLNLYGKQVLKYLRDESQKKTKMIPLAESLYDHMVSITGVYATLGLMSFTFPVKIWCSKSDKSFGDDSFFLYCRIETLEGENLERVPDMIEETVKAVASQYFGVGVQFDRHSMPCPNGHAFYKWKITEIPLAGKLKVSPDIQQDRLQKHLVLQVGLSPQQLDKLFPFHCVFDSALFIVQCGEKFIEVFSSSVVGSKISDNFDVSSESGHSLPSWDDICSKMKGEESHLSDVVKDFSISTSSQRTPLGFSGGLIGDLSFSLTNDVAVFLCFPNVSTLERMQDLGVEMKHLAKSNRLQLQKDARSDTMKGMKIMASGHADYAMNQLKMALTTAENKLLTKQAFVRYVSHEIRTPMMVVDIGMKLLEKDLKKMYGMRGHSKGGAPMSTRPPKNSERNDRKLGGSPGRYDEEDVIVQSLQTITDCKRSMDVAIGILNDLLAYEKIESGLFQVNKEPVLASQFFKDAVSELGLQASEKSINIEFKDYLPYPDNLYVNIDVKKIKQVVRNMMSNAIKFSAPHSTVTVTLRYSQIGSSGATSAELTLEETILLKESTRTTTPSPSKEELKMCGDGTASSADSFGGAEGEVKDVDMREKGAEEDIVIVNGKECKKYGLIIVSFVDCGVGISKADQQLIYKKIVQFKPDELQNGGGSGLGLYISRGIVRTHGGNTGVFSEGEGHGSNFFFSLSLYLLSSNEKKDNDSCNTEEGQHNHEADNVSAEDQRQREDALEEKMKTFVGLRVLVVDDSRMVRKMMAKVLTTLGSTVREATDGQQAVDIVRECMEGPEAGEAELCREGENGDSAWSRSEFDLILMDSVMPRMSGLEATEIIVKQLGFSNLIVGVTGNVLAADTADFLERGATAVLPKPLVMEDLADTIATATTPFAKTSPPQDVP